MTGLLPGAADDHGVLLLCKHLEVGMIFANDATPPYRTAGEDKEERTQHAGERTTRKVGRCAIDWEGCAPWSFASNLLLGAQLHHLPGRSSHLIYS